MTDRQRFILARKRMGLTQEQVASKGGISTKSVSRLENGEDVDESTKQVVAAVLRLNLTQTELFDIETADELIGDVEWAERQKFSSYLAEQFRDLESIANASAFTGLSVSAIESHLACEVMPPPGQRASYAAFLNVPPAEFEKAWRTQRSLVVYVGDALRSRIIRESLRRNTKNISDLAIQLIEERLEQEEQNTRKIGHANTDDRVAAHKDRTHSRKRSAHDIELMKIAPNAVKNPQTAPVFVDDPFVDHVQIVAPEGVLNPVRNKIVDPLPTTTGFQLYRYESYHDGFHRLIVEAKDMPREEVVKRLLPGWHVDYGPLPDSLQWLSGKPIVKRFERIEADSSSQPDGSLAQGSFNLPSGTFARKNKIAAKLRPKPQS